MSSYIYGNPSPGSPIDYSTPIAVTAATTFTTPTLAVGTNRFAVRAFDGWGDSGFGGGQWSGAGTQFGLGGLDQAGFGSGEEQNLDCALTITLDADGRDITDLPPAPLGLRAFPRPGGSLRVEWLAPEAPTARRPTGYRVYLGTGGVVDYSSPAATIAAESGAFGSYQANLAGLTGGAVYTVGVRARNASGEEANTTTTAATPKAVGPAAVSSLAATATV